MRQQQAQELGRLTRELTSVLASASWRATAVLRALAARARRRLRRVLLESAVVAPPPAPDKSVERTVRPSAAREADYAA